MERKYRLREQADFQRTRHKGRCWSCRLMVLCIARNSLPYSRFGFSVSKRVGKATVRNRVRRRLREAVRHEQTGIAPGWDLVFVARQPIAAASYAEIAATVREMLAQAGVWPATVGCESSTSVGTGK